MDASCVNIGNISTTDISLIYIKNIPTRNVSGRTQEYNYCLQWAYVYKC